MLKADFAHTLPTARVLLTAAEAYPELERLFLGAQCEIWCGFHVFDLRTRLRSMEARTIGDSWFDLVAHTLSRGVRINMILSDFDPIIGTRLHRGTWSTLRRFRAAAEVAGPDAPLRIIAAMHPARSGILVRLALWPAAMRRIGRVVAILNMQGRSARAAALRDMPGLSRALSLTADGKVRRRLWHLPRLYPATHHQKMAVIDRRTLYIGGLDLDERRYDTPDHDQDSAQTWHDVQLILTGSVVADAQRHLETFQDVCAGRTVPAGGGDFIRTLSRRRLRNFRWIGPKPVIKEILTAHRALAEQADDFIYLETQYFRDRKFARHLARLARRNSSLNLVLILPGAPEDIAFHAATGLDARYGEYLQAKCIRIVEEAFGDRCFIGSGVQARAAQAQCPDAPKARNRLAGSQLIYIHSKVSIFDGRAAVVSSANLNGRSLRWDTEAGVVLKDPLLMESMRRRVMAHWLPEDAGQEMLGGPRLAARWRAMAQKNLSMLPAARFCRCLPYDRRAAEAFGWDASPLPEALV